MEVVCFLVAQAAASWGVVCERMVIRIHASLAVLFAAIELLCCAAGLLL
jgi:hypothetical protein